MGNITGLVFRNITVLGAGKAGIGIVSMDGAHISNALYEDISMTAVSNVVFMYIGARANQVSTHPCVRVFARAGGLVGAHSASKDPCTRA